MPVAAEPFPSANGGTATPKVGQLAGLFLRLGCTAFGGPAAHIAMMEDEVVTRRRWLSREKFLDLLGATNLIPGPNSTEMAMHIGLLAGWMGFLVAGVCFILPAAIITGFLAWLYVEFGELPQAEGVLYGIKPVVIALVLVALLRLARVSFKEASLVIIGVASAIANAVGVHELLVLLAAGIAAMIGAPLARRPTKQLPNSGNVSLLAAAPVALLGAVGGGAATAVPFGLWPLFLFFAKTGSVLFGSGYVLLAFLRTDFVERTGWLAEDQLMDAISIGQFTPGPVSSTATFVGYLLGGGPGAVVATAGIFLPAFFFVSISGPLVPQLRRSHTAGAFLDGVVVASLALVAVVTWQLGGSALVDAPCVVLAAASLFMLARYRVNAVWLLLAGALAGVIKAAIERL